MLSTQEIQQIKEGVATIRQQVPDADVVTIVRMFNQVFGHKLSDEERYDAETLIESEWKEGLM